MAVRSGEGEELLADAGYPNGFETTIWVRRTAAC
jgi:hypothetical protein